MTKRIAIVQSSYIPWKGYFDLVRSVDEFVLYDDMQFTRRDWRSRNQIKTTNGLQWLSVPIDVKGKFDQRIKDAQTAGNAWAAKHWSSLCLNYGKASFFRDYAPSLEDLYLQLSNETSLSTINSRLIRWMCGAMAITTPITWSMDYLQREGKSDRLLSVCQAAGASHYLSGPAARDYLDTDLFAAAGVSVSFADYSDYPSYPQLHPPFVHAVSALDLLFNTGPDASEFMKLQR